jgi:acyl transferase domain-containing protein
LQDALHLIAVRARLVSELPTGSMLSVRLLQRAISSVTAKTLSCCCKFFCVCVVAGEDDKIKEFAQSLTIVANKLLVTSHAFHSDMMEPIVATLSKR